MSDSPDETSLPVVQGQALTPLDRFWLDTMRKTVQESVASLEKAAKQLVGIASLSQTIYFAAISLSDLKKTLEQVAPMQQGAAAFALVLPLLCWIASLVFAILVFKPETYSTNLNSPDLARDTYREIVAYKHRQLRRAHLALMLGFLPLVVNVVVYLLAG